MPVEVVPTYGNVIKVWWAYTWRWVVCVPAIFAILFALQFLATLANVDPEILKNIMRAVSFICGILMSQWVFRRLLIKGFGRFRLAMVEK